MMVAACHINHSASVGFAEYALNSCCAHTSASLLHIIQSVHASLRAACFMMWPVLPFPCVLVWLVMQAVQPGRPHPAVDPNRSQCFAAVWPPPDAGTWHGYPFINNVAMLADPSVSAHLQYHYGMAMKTDFDTFLSPAFLHFWPDTWVHMPWPASRVSGVRWPLVHT